MTAYLLLIIFLALWASAGTIAVLVVLSAGRCCGGDDIEALAEAVREHPPPRPLPNRWTNDDWAELEREQSQ